jgi:hypothetical protein
MNITNDPVVQRSLRYNIYQLERKRFDEQHTGEGYHHDFTYQFNITWKCEPDVKIKQLVTVKGRATCNCSFGFNIYTDPITAKEAVVP